MNGMERRNECMYGMDGCFDFCRANESLSGIVQGNNIGSWDSPVILGIRVGADRHWRRVGGEKCGAAAAVAASLID